MAWRPSFTYTSTQPRSTHTRSLSWGGTVAAITLCCGLTVDYHTTDLIVERHVRVSAIFSRMNLQTSTFRSGGVEIDGHFDFHGFSIISNGLLAIDTK